MTDGSDRLLRDVFVEAAEIADPAARGAFLARACGDDGELRRRVEALLAIEASAEIPSEVVLGSPAEALPGSRIGGYKVLERIGEGGCGVVFMAEQERPVRRRVALKAIKLGMDTRQVVARFEAERQALAMMDHPGIAKVFEAGAIPQWRDRPFFAMELVRGMPITEYCDRGRLGTRERLGLFVQVCHAVQHAHQKGVIHRDLKPSNVLVTEVDGIPRPKVIDFGIARAIEGRLTDATLFTAFEQLLGTPSYMSPEQASMIASDIDTRSDIYSLGVLLYELLTGSTPFDARTLLEAGLDEMRRTIREVDPERPSTRLRHTAATSGAIPCKGVPGAPLASDLDWIAMKCLEKDRRRRYDTAHGLARDVERHLRGEPVEAHPPSLGYRLGKAVHRHRGAFATAVALAVVLAAGLAGVLWQWRRAVDAERQALEDRNRAVAAETRATSERDKARRLAAVAALEKGQSKLESGDCLGLLDFVEAFRLAERDLELRGAVGRRWATWHAEWDQRTIAVRSCGGVVSPDFLRSASLTNWPPLNASREVTLDDILTGTVLSGPLVHESAAKGGAFSPDGTLLATVTENGVVHLWDSSAGLPAHPPCETGIANLDQVAFSPDGRSLVAFSLGAAGPGTRHVAFLSLEDSPPSVRVRTHRYRVRRALFSPDGALLAVQCPPDLQLWRTADLQPVGPPVGLSTSGLLEFDAGGTRLALNPNDGGGIRLLDPRRLDVVRTLSATDGSSRLGAFSRDGRLLGAVGWDNTLRLWDLESTGSEPYATLGLRERESGRLAFSPDGSLLAIGEVAGTVRVIRADDGRPVRALPTLPYANARFLESGVLAARASQEAIFWDLSAPPLPGFGLADDALAHSLAFDSTGETLAVGGDRELRLWKMKGAPRCDLVVPMPGRVTALAFVESEGRFMGFTDDGALSEIDPATGETSERCRPGLGYDMAAALAPDGRTLALIGFSEGILVDTRTGLLDPLDLPGGFLSVAFRRDSTAMALGLASSRVFLFDTSANPAVSAGEVESPGGWVHDVDYQPGGGLLALVLDHAVVRLHEVGTGRQVGEAVRPTLDQVDLVRFSPDGSLLAFAGTRAEGGAGVELWHLDAGGGLHRGASTLGSDHPITCLAFSPDGRRLVAGGVGSTRIWELPAPPRTGEQIEGETWATLGFRTDERGDPIFVPSPIDDVEGVRRRLTEAASSLRTPLDAALAHAPEQALEALEALVDDDSRTGVHRRLQGRLCESLMRSAASDGSWAEAIAHGHAAVRRGWDDPVMLAHLALLHLTTGDLPGYRAQCRETLERHGASDDPLVIRWVATAAVLQPRSLDDYSVLLAALRRTSSRAFGAQRPALRLFLGAVLARAGRHREALGELEPALRNFEAEGAAGEGFLSTYTRFLLAICHARVGRSDIARERFEEASASVRSLIESDAGESDPDLWVNRLALELFRNEAESAIEASAPGPAEPVSD